VAGALNGDGCTLVAVIGGEVAGFVAGFYERALGYERRALRLRK
jgi:hypothetical protein